MEVIQWQAQMMKSTFGLAKMSWLIGHHVVTHGCMNKQSLNTMDNNG